MSPASDQDTSCAVCRDGVRRRPASSTRTAAWPTPPEFYDSPQEATCQAPALDGLVHRLGPTR
ncbi:hypothetical protein [Streptomyces filipinensis]|uniref:hypothetical protein n=1 Tax=Streptomyces filipinensis TaxID=66887 RepID=UPI00177DA938|nr:hypothetical protein [Streptomyces filipinensis]